MGSKTCPDCKGPKYKYANFCNRCKSKGVRNGRYGKPVSAETRERIGAKAKDRIRGPQKKRNPSSVHGGRLFARRWFAMPKLCERCKACAPMDRHHKDGNTQNNDRSNLAFLCRKCHQKEDGRHVFLRTQMPSMGGRACASAKRLAQEVLAL